MHSALAGGDAGATNRFPGTETAVVTVLVLRVVLSILVILCGVVVHVSHAADVEQAGNSTPTVDDVTVNQDGTLAFQDEKWQQVEPCFLS